MRVPFLSNVALLFLLQGLLNVIVKPLKGFGSCQTLPFHPGIYWSKEKETM